MTNTITLRAITFTNFTVPVATVTVTKTTAWLSVGRTTGSGSISLLERWPHLHHHVARLRAGRWCLSVCRRHVLGSAAEERIVEDKPQHFDEQWWYIHIDKI